MIITLATNKKFLEKTLLPLLIVGVRTLLIFYGGALRTKNLLLLGLVIFLLFRFMIMFVSWFNMGNVQEWGILDIAENAATLKSLLPSVSSMVTLGRQNVAFSLKSLEG
jgi:hypothetical protein